MALPKSALNIRMLMRTLGLLLLIETAFMCIPVIVGFCYREPDAVKFLIALAINLVCGLMMVSIKPKSRDMGKREAIFLTGMTWIVLSLFGMLPFLLCGTHLNVTDAFFETMSGFTTTGASVLATLKGVPHSILLWRCIIQWIGGMGIILFTLAVVPMLNYTGGIKLFNAEVTGITHDKLRPRVSSTAKSLWFVYISLTTVLVVLLLFSPLNTFDAFCYSLSTMSTGGFATTDMSVIAEGSLYVKTVVIVFMFLGGVNFALIFKAIQGQFKQVVRNDTLKWYFGIVMIAYAALCINLVSKGLVNSFEDVTIDPLFQAVSIISSTGIIEPDIMDWGSFAYLLMIFMMFTGACAGSTSGGAKLDRIIILFKFIKNEFYKMMHPNSVTVVCINGKGTPNTVVMKALSFLFLYIMVILAGGAIINLCGMPMVDSIFCSLSAISNTGLGTKITGVTGDYSLVPDVVKWILSLIMLIGRLELYTILLWFTPTFWKR